MRAGPELPQDAAASEFRPANETEEMLHNAAKTGDRDKFLEALLMATVLVPVPADAPDGVEFGVPGFRWQIMEWATRACIGVFTSEERFAAYVDADTRAVSAGFVSVIRVWPDEDLVLVINPGTPVGASLPGRQVVSLASWAAEIGLTETPDGAGTQLVMQKAIPHEQVAFYLEHGYDRVSGFVYPARDLRQADTPAALYAATGLDRYAGTTFALTDESVHVVRWAAHDEGFYRLAYGGQSEDGMHADGWVVEGLPFRGNGYAPSEGTQMIPEYKVDSLRLPHGAEIYRLDADGSETFVASFDADTGGWAQPGDADA